MNIDDKVEVSCSGRITETRRKTYGNKEIMYTVEVGEGNDSYFIAVPESAIVKVEA